MFKSLIGLALAYMQELFSQQGTDCELHNSFRKLTSSQPRTNYLKRNSCHNGAPVWTSLPESIRLKIKSIGQVKKIDFAIKSSDSHSAILSNSVEAVLLILHSYLTNKQAYSPCTIHCDKTRRAFKNTREIILRILSQFICPSPHGF